MAPKPAENVCSFCALATPRVICTRCVEVLRAGDALGACDFCDHPSPQGTRDDARAITICGDCLAFARQVLADTDERAPDEGRLDPDLLWSDLTPAPRPDVDPDSPATAHAELALAFFEMGLFDDAREQVGKALDLDPRHPVALRIIEKLPAPGSSQKGR
jgi:hypothetical protein